MNPASQPSEPPALRSVSGPASTLTSFARVLTHRPGAVGPETTVSPHGVELRWSTSADTLADYRAIVGSGAQMPLTFPALIAFRLHRDLMGQGDLPANGLGMVHVATELWSSGRLPVDSPWHVAAWADGTRHTRSGLEMDLWARCRTDDAAWTARVVVLSRSKSARGDDASAAPDLPVRSPDWRVESTLTADGSIGRAFARVSGDVNPIHLHALTAKPFGFARAIAHGWWLLPRALALLDVDETPLDGGRYLAISYRRPVLLPSRPALVATTHDGQAAFLALRADGQPHFGGQLLETAR